MRRVAFLLLAVVVTLNLNAVPALRVARDPGPFERIVRFLQRLIPVHTSDLIQPITPIPQTEIQPGTPVPGNP